MIAVGLAPTCFELQAGNHVGRRLAMIGDDSTRAGDNEKRRRRRMTLRERARNSNEFMAVGD